MNYVSTAHLLHSEDFPLPQFLKTGESTPLIAHLVFSGDLPAKDLESISARYRIRFYPKTIIGGISIIDIAEWTDIPIDTDTMWLDTDGMNSEINFNLPDLSAQEEDGQIVIDLEFLCKETGFNMTGAIDKVAISNFDNTEAQVPEPVPTTVVGDSFLYNINTGRRDDPNQIRLSLMIENINLNDSVHTLTYDIDVITTDAEGNITETTNYNNSIGFAYNPLSDYSQCITSFDVPDQPSNYGVIRINSLSIRENNSGLVLTDEIVIPDNTINFGLIEEPQITPPHDLILSCGSSMVLMDYSGVFKMIGRFTVNRAVKEVGTVSVKYYFDVFLKRPDGSEYLYKSTNAYRTFDLDGTKDQEFITQYLVTNTNGEFDGYSVKMVINNIECNVLSGEFDNVKIINTNDFYFYQSMNPEENKKQLQLNLEDMTLTEQQIKDLFTYRFRDKKVKLTTEAFNGSLKQFKAILNRQTTRRNKYLILTAKLSGIPAEDTTVKFLDETLAVAEFSADNAIGFTSLTNIFVDDVETGTNDDMIIQVAYIYAHTTDQQCGI